MSDINPNPPTDNPPNPQTGGTPGEAPANPAARTVLTGQISEREIDLEAQLREERERHATTAKEKKERENRINELEDDLRKARQTSQPEPKPKKSMMAAWLAGEDEP